MWVGMVEGADSAKTKMWQVKGAWSQHFCVRLAKWKSPFSISRSATDKRIYGQADYIPCFSLATLMREGGHYSLFI